MAKRVYEFGRAWDARVPRYDIKWLLGRYHVGTSDMEIEVNIRRRCQDAVGFTPAIVRQCVAYALECHRRNGALYRAMMSGRVG